jgi:hypothetical protein
MTNMTPDPNITKLVVMIGGFLVFPDAGGGRVAVCDRWPLKVLKVDIVLASESYIFLKINSTK